MKFTALVSVALLLGTLGCKDENESGGKQSEGGSTTSVLPGTGTAKVMTPAKYKLEGKEYSAQDSTMCGDKAVPATTVAKDLQGCVLKEAKLSSVEGGAVTSPIFPPPPSQTRVFATTGFPSQCWALAQATGYIFEYTRGPYYGSQGGFLVHYYECWGRRASLLHFAAGGSTSALGDKGFDPRAAESNVRNAGSQGPEGGASATSLAPPIPPPTKAAEGGSVTSPLINPPGARQCGYSTHPSGCYSAAAMSGCSFVTRVEGPYHGWMPNSSIYGYYYRCYGR